MFSELGQRVQEKNFQLVQAMKDAPIEVCTAVELPTGPMLEAWDAAVPEIDRRINGKAV